MKALYRIVNALLAAALIPTAIFADLILFQVSTTLLDAGMEESISIKFIIDVLTGKEEFWAQILPDAGSFSWPAALDPIKGRLITFAVCFVLVIIAALFIIIWSICSDKRIPVFVASVAALISTIVMIACFNSAAALFMDGTINVVEIFSSGWLVSLIGSIVLVDYLGLGGFQSGWIFLIIGLIVWTGAYYIVEIGENEEEKPKKIK